MIKATTTTVSSINIKNSLSIIIIGLIGCFFFLFESILIDRKGLLNNDTKNSNNNFDDAIIISNPRLLTNTNNNNNNNNDYIIRTSYLQPKIAKQQLKHQQRLQIIPTAAVCAIAKHEAPYINEWVDYNIGIGFSSIYIYDNTDRYELEQWGIAQQLSNRPIYVTNITGWSQQCTAYYNCANRAIRDNHTYVMFYDIDEFLVVQPPKSLLSSSPKNNNYAFHVIDFVTEYLPHGSLSLNWEIFGTSGKQVYEPIPILKRFQYKVPVNYARNTLTKSLVKIQDMNMSKPCKDPHYFPLKNYTYQRLTNGKKFKGSLNSINTRGTASIYHIYYKSYEEYIAKRLRGAGFFGNRTIKTLSNEALRNIGVDGNPIPIGSIYDDTAWKILTTVAPKYKFYDIITPSSQTAQGSIQHPYIVHYQDPDATTTQTTTTKTKT